MVKVTFDYGSDEDKALVTKMLGGEATVVGKVEATLQEKVAEAKEAAKQALTPPAPDTPAPSEPVVNEAPSRSITPEAALPLVGAYCQEKGAEGVAMAQGLMDEYGASKLNELNTKQLVDFLDKLGIRW